MKFINLRGRRQLMIRDSFAVVECMLRLASPLLCVNALLRSPAFKTAVGAPVRCSFSHIEGATAQPH